MEFSVELTVTELGHEDENASRLFEALQRVVPRLSPVLAGNFASGLLETVFQVDARDASEALVEGRRIFDAAVADADLPVTRLVGIEVVLEEIAARAA